MSDDLNYYRIPKHRAAARMTLAGLEPRDVRLFLAEHSMFRAGPDEPADLFRDQRTFIPVEDPEWGLVLLRREAIMVMSISARMHDAALEKSRGVALEEIHQRTNVTVFLRDGSMYRGLVGLFRLDLHRRMQDFLNEQEPFFLVRDEEQVHFINKDWIVWVKP
jgi:hypothetical protein